MRLFVAAVVLAFASAPLACQIAQGMPEPVTLPHVTVHGTVSNAATGEPLPRALVQAGGESGQAALTDGDGRFELANVPAGLNVFQITRPGFRDTVLGFDGSPLSLSDPAVAHAVFVLAGMNDLAFAMKPTNVIRGQVDLSTGESAQGISIMLLRRTIQDGRGVWRPVGNTRTNADGVFRFAGLNDGDYAIYTDPSMEGEIPVAVVQPGSEDTFTRSGFAATYYPDARDFSASGRISLRNGDTAAANIRLVLEPFHMVQAEVTRSSARAGAEGSLNAVVNDAEGHQLPYTAVYDAANHTVQSLLPDGAYTLRVNYVGAPPATFNPSPRNAHVEGGQIEITVKGRNLTHLRIPIAPEVSNTVQVNLQRGATQAQPVPEGMQRAYVLLSQAGGGITDGMVAQFAEGHVPGTLQSTPTGPGAYWVHVSNGPGMCEASFTAGGASLAREPLILNASGASAPLTLTLRDDCASLHLNMPANVPRLATGEEPSFTVYVVPDFDSTADVTPITLRPSSGGSAVVQSLTPGSYHVYAFPAPVAFEYRNRDVLASAPSQQITLDPGATATLTLEATAQ